MRKLVSYLCLIVMAVGMVTLLTSQGTKAEMENSSSVLEQAFLATDAQVEQYSVRGFAVKKNQWMEWEDVSRLAHALAASMNMKNIKQENTKQADENQVRLYGQWDDQTHIMVSVLSMKKSQMDVQTITIIKVDRQGNSWQPLNSIQKRLRYTALFYGIPMEISTTLQGTVAAYWNEKQQEQIIGRVFRTVGAKEVEGLQSPKVTSISAYTPKIAEHIVSRQRPINLQVAAHYDQYRQKTHVVIGSPVITVEY
ncbi:hypothetical protein DNHGIG_19870 [Collibacillus ludicampi]|uniref:TATA-box binding protein n=1 Tax=Collibacillus ludicampi TaxID=2771369 RepID=A0AAV4LFJ5_9BACL|nr:YwmB family TATA-box binding protein [Collibacillus ludicampi]GIM46438.1 hypothetical protein DNHGIG_19870 [Collibacillus ludicampi]